MVAPINSNRKGIYRDLYREIDADNKKNQIIRPRKGIYVNLYNQIENDRSMASKGNLKNEGLNFLYSQFTQIIQNITNVILSKLSYFFLFAKGYAKILLLVLTVSKKPIKNYIESNIQVYSNQGNYYNGR